MNDQHPLTVFGRLLQCRTCKADVDLLDLPTPWIDAATYQCGLCLKPVEIAVRPPAPWEKPARRDMSTYDPRTEPIPF